MKTSKFFWGLGLIILAVIIILDALCVIIPISSIVGDVSLFAVIAGFFLLSFVISRIFQGKLSEIFVPLSFVFMLFEKNIAFMLNRDDPNIINNWLLFLCAILLSVGISILTPSKRSKKHTRSSDSDCETISKEMSASTVYIDCSDFTTKRVLNKMGSCSIYFENAELYTGGGVLDIDNRMGAMTIHVPASWKINSEYENKMGFAEIVENRSGDGPELTITGEIKMGYLTIKSV